jgi:hypothetical protein
MECEAGVTGAPPSPKLDRLDIAALCVSALRLVENHIDFPVLDLYLWGVDGGKKVCKNLFVTARHVGGHEVR